MGVAWLVGKFNVLRKWFVVVGLIIVDLLIGAVIEVIPFSINPESYLLVIALLLCQMTIKTSLYEEVAVSELKKGMILSLFSSMLMQNSRVRRLPGISTEDLKSRLSVEEIDSIQRWAENRTITHVTVVRKIPFAIFVFLGFLSYFAIWGVIK